MSYIAVKSWVIARLSVRRGAAVCSVNRIQEPVEQSKLYIKFAFGQVGLVHYCILRIHNRHNYLDVEICLAAGRALLGGRIIDAVDLGSKPLRNSRIEIPVE